MNSGSSSSAGMGALGDPGIQQFVQRETEKQKMQAIIHELNEKCWDHCMDGVKPSSKLDSKSANCISKCVERFLDVNIMVTKRIEAKATELLQKHDSFGME